ncbi:MAG: ABC transporter substrate-binding protein [Nostoc sp.]|uniref:caspase, EACC1-associated type n=1 Tax=Nostoc sp. TaxID=1180 RepID=UPI002FF90942
MAKVALLIGVSEYEPGLTPLPAATKDVEAMQRVLLNPQIGGFDDVTLLINPQRQAMEEAIETLFAGRQKDDLLLLFFSGHGIKDESGKLYFAARNTRKNSHGKLVETTTVAASSVHKFMSDSRSRREVVILDCCFSGAFAEGMLARDDGFVDVRNQLGGEGRAVLTSSTSTQYSFEQQGADTSTYTRYIVEGLETGVADRDQDGLISVDELHDYATRKVQEASPAMRPEIYAVREGFKIKLAKAPTDEPKIKERKYREEVEFCLKSGNGEISLAGRATLNELRQSLRLTPEEAGNIETQVLEPIEVYKQKLQRYEQTLRNEIERKFPLTDNTRALLQRLQQVLGLRDEDITLVEAPILAEQTDRVIEQTVITTSKNSDFLRYIGACIIGVVIGGAIIYALLREESQPIPNSCANKEQYSLGNRISLGEEILVKQDTNRDKEDGVKALANDDCKAAIDKFNSYRRTNLRDPEALIYLNNAKARLKGDKLKIAVSVPIGGTDANPDVAKEMLRGVAQAQDEVNNSSDGINHKALEVVIANDDNEKSPAQNIAKQFVKDQSILSVVGHNASEAALAAAQEYAAQEYKERRLVMISPTSFDQRLSGLSKYVFRTVSTNNLAKRLTNYIINTAGKTNIVICVDADSLDNSGFADQFIKATEEAKYKINPTLCNLADSIDPKAIISQALSSKADGLLLAPSIKRINKALEVARANRGQLPLFGSPTLYTQQTIGGEGKADVNGLVLAAPWHPQAIPSNPFAQKAQTLWGGPVNWRTATTYDATLAIIAGLRQSNTREELQKTLHNLSYPIDGATGKFQFSKSGDRKNNLTCLIKVQQKPRTDTYEFVPIQPEFCRFTQ